MSRAAISPDGSALTVRVPLTFRKRGGHKLVIAPNGSDSWAPPRPRIDNTMIKALARAFRGREDQFVLCGSRPAADPAIAGDRRGDSGWAAAGGPTARGLAAAVSGRMEGAASRDLGPLSLTRSRASAVLCSVIRLANPMRAGRRGCSPATSFSRRVSPPSFRAV
jgi:hypothetical protein